jgi:hypothetical protein
MSLIWKNVQLTPVPDTSGWLVRIDYELEPGFKFSSDTRWEVRVSPLSNRLYSSCSPLKPSLFKWFEDVAAENRSIGMEKSLSGLFLLL